MGTLLPITVIKTAISLEAGLLGRIDEVARELDVPRSRLLSQAATQFLERYDNAHLLARLNCRARRWPHGWGTDDPRRPTHYPPTADPARAVIRQGSVYWVGLDPPDGPSGPAFRHPHVVVQNNVFNRSRIGTVVVCSLTSNLSRAQSPGNVLLAAGEAGLSRQSVVNVSQLFTIDKDALVEEIGRLSSERLREVLDGIELLLEPRDTAEQAVKPAVA